MSTAFEHPFNKLLTGVAWAEVKDPQGIEPPSTIIQVEHQWGSGCLPVWGVGS